MLTPGRVSCRPASHSHGAEAPLVFRHLAELGFRSGHRFFPGVQARPETFHGDGLARFGNFPGLRVDQMQAHLVPDEVRDLDVIVDSGWGLIRRRRASIALSRIFMSVFLGSGLLLFVQAYPPVRGLEGSLWVPVPGQVEVRAGGCPVCCPSALSGLRRGPFGGGASAISLPRTLGRRFVGECPSLERLCA